MELGTQRFALLPLFLLGTAFTLLSPLFWTHVESPSSDVTGMGRDNMELYGRVVPTLDYGFRHLRAGEVPLWTNTQYCGIPFFANPTHGLLQPLNLIFLFVPVPMGLALHAFLGLLLMGFSLALYLRALGTGYLAAAMGGMVYAFGGASAAVMSRPELLGVLAWTPFLYWIVYEHTIRFRGTFVVLGGGVVALMMLSGAPALALILVSGGLCYGIARALAGGRKGDTARFRVVGSLLMMGVTGMALSAVQWLPFLTWLTTLAHPVEAIWPWTWMGHAPVNGAEVAGAFLLPGNSTLPELFYIGVVSLILIPPAILQKHGRLEVIYFALAALLWMGGVVWQLDGGTSLEIWKALAFPGVFALAVLVGLGSDRLLLTGRDPRSPLIWGSSLLVLIAGGTLLVLGPSDARGLVLAALVVLLPFFLLRVKWMAIACGTLLAFLLFIDLRGASSSTFQHPYAAGTSWLQDAMPTMREAEALSVGERVLTLPTIRQTTLPANVGLLLGINNAHGAYWPLTTGQARWWEHLEDYLNPARYTESMATDVAHFYPRLLNYMGVRLFIGERNLPWMDEPPEKNGIDIQFLRTLGRLFLWRNNSAYPRIRMVHQWEPVADEEAALDRLLSRNFQGDRVCVVEAGDRDGQALRDVLPPVDGTTSTQTASSARCTLRSESGESLLIDVDTDDSGILILADNYASGWRVHVDGKRATLLKVNGLFRGVQVPAGTHEVQFSYAPMSVTLGLLLSIGAALVCLFWLLRSLGRWCMALLRGTGQDNRDPQPLPLSPQTPTKENHP